jgi:hypothetical protein
MRPARKPPQDAWPRACRRVFLQTDIANGRPPRPSCRGDTSARSPSTGQDAGDRLAARGVRGPQRLGERFECCYIACGQRVTPSWRMALVPRCDAFAPLSPHRGAIPRHGDPQEPWREPGMPSDGIGRCSRPSPNASGAVVDPRSWRRAARSRRASGCVPARPSGWRRGCSAGRTSARSRVRCDGQRGRHRVGSHAASSRRKAGRLHRLCSVGPSRTGEGAQAPRQHSWAYGLGVSVLGAVRSRAPP